MLPSPRAVRGVWGPDGIHSRRGEGARGPSWRLSMQLDLIRLDRDVARAVLAWRAAISVLRRRGPEPGLDAGDARDAETSTPYAPLLLDNPLDPFRRVSSRSTYLELL